MTVFGRATLRIIRISIIGMQCNHRQDAAEETTEKGGSFRRQANEVGGAEAGRQGRGVVRVLWQFEAQNSRSAVD